MASGGNQAVFSLLSPLAVPLLLKPRLAVVLVGVYLALNAVVVGDALVHVATGSTLVTDWWSALTQEHSSALAVIGVALVAFPKLALGLSGFETGVLVMPQVADGEGAAGERLTRRISGTGGLLSVAAAIMAVLLLTSSFVTAVLIRRRSSSPAEAPTAGLRPTWRTCTWATGSAPPMTSARSRSCGSLAPRPWPACST